MVSSAAALTVFGAKLTWRAIAATTVIPFPVSVCVPQRIWPGKRRVSCIKLVLQRRMWCQDVDGFFFFFLGGFSAAQAKYIKCQTAPFLLVKQLL